MTIEMQQSCDCDMDNVPIHPFILLHTSPVVVNRRQHTTQIVVTNKKSANRGI